MCQPVAIEHPGTERELVAVVKRAAALGRPIKVAGAGHSFNDIACTDGVLIVLDHYNRILGVDRDEAWVTVQAGIRLRRLNGALAARGLGLENLGDVAYQSVAGAMSTATHGTGAAFGGLATQVLAMEVITADGSVIRCSADEEPEIFQAARVGLGALGVVSIVTLRCVPAFNLRAVEQPMDLDHVLDHFEEYVGDNDHFEFYWVPHTNLALTKQNNRTEEPAGGRWWAARFRDRVLMENVAFGALCRAGRAVPALIPRLAPLMATGGRADYVDRSYRVFTSPRYVRFHEMEYAIPVADAVGAVRQVAEMTARLGLRVSFPVEVRVSAADNIPLSMATGRASAYIAVHVYHATPHEPYFRAAEEIFDALGGRPHWGKRHWQTAATLASRYPQWDRWQAVRRRLDPDGHFTNGYLDRVLGPVT